MTTNTTEILSDPQEQPTRHIGLLLFDGVEELDAVGPWEVLAHWTQTYPQDGWSVSCLSADGSSVTAATVLPPASAVLPVRQAPPPHRP